MGRVVVRVATTMVVVRVVMARRRRRRFRIAVPGFVVLLVDSVRHVPGSVVLLVDSVRHGGKEALVTSTVFS